MPHAPSRLKYSIVFNRVFLKPATSELWTDSFHYYVNNVRWPIFFKESTWFLFSIPYLTNKVRGDRLRIKFAFNTSNLYIMKPRSWWSFCCSVWFYFAFCERWVAVYIHEYPNSFMINDWGSFKEIITCCPQKKNYSSSSPNECSNK